MRFLLLFIAAVIAVFAGIAAMQLTSPAPEATTAKTEAQPKTPASVNTVDVLVAKSAIPVGTVITAAMVDKQPWPENLVLAGFIVGNGPNATIVGKVARASFQVREPFLASKISGTNETGFLAASLPEGMRAVTIATDTVSGVAGFVFAGDRVDLLFTHNVPEDIHTMESGPGANKGGINGKPGFTEVLAANVPVLAINLREKDDNAANNNTTAAVSGTTSSVAPSSMTLQVSDMQAEKIRLAEKVGSLSIALRSVNDRDKNNVAPPADLMSLTQMHTEEAPIPQQPDTVKVVKGGDYGAANQQRTGGGK